MQFNVVCLIMVFGTPFNVKGMPFNVSPSQQDEALCIVWRRLLDFGQILVYHPVRYTI